MSNPGPKPSIPYWHLYVDEVGVCHQRECRLTGYGLRRIGVMSARLRPLPIGRVRA